MYIRSKASIEKYGENVNVLLRPDSKLLVVTTSKDCILTYSVVFNFSSRQLGVFTYSDNSPLFIYEGQTISTAFPGPGEAIGIRELLIQFKMVIRLDSGISCAIALDHDLLVLTKNPPAIQLVKWNSFVGAKLTNHDNSSQSTRLAASTTNFLRFNIKISPCAQLLEQSDGFILMDNI